MHKKRRGNSTKLTEVVNAINAFSIYSTTIIIRYLQIITRKTHQPRGVEEGSGMIGNLLFGVHLRSAALITHIEHEPIRREGSLHVEIPHIPYPSFDNSNGNNNNGGDGWNSPMSRNKLNQTHYSLSSPKSNATRRRSISPTVTTTTSAAAEVDEYKPVIMVAFVHDQHIRGKRSTTGGTYGG